jgi:1,2-diacylglycerol 3-alpha-glucosyltransferase
LACFVAGQLARDETEVFQRVRTIVIFDNFGPYHKARLRASARICDLLAIQVGGSSAEYAWDNAASADTFKFTTLFQQGTSQDGQLPELIRKLNQTLDDFRPEVVFVPGWMDKTAFTALRWSVRHGVPAVAMSESTEWDARRSVWKERVKRKVVDLFSAALVGGNPHKTYMEQLGIPPERIHLGYDAVDNRFFADAAAEVRRHPSEVRKKNELPQNYFLASARFIEKKNLSRLLAAYARYRELAGKSDNGKQKAEVWELVLLGDGPLKSDLCRQISELGLQRCVRLPGFKQYGDLPSYYGLAGAFIHASTTEQWGLVVNEAMASGLPVLVSKRCGCAADLVQEGRNGFTFDPYIGEQCAELMLKISASNFPLSAFGSESQCIIAEWGPDRFALGLKAAAHSAVEAGPRRAGSVQKLLLWGLCFR